MLIITTDYRNTPTYIETQAIDLIQVKKDEVIIYVNEHSVTMVEKVFNKDILPHLNTVVSVQGQA